MDEKLLNIRAEVYSNGLIFPKPDSEVRAIIKQAFKDGACWRDNSIWHSPAEKPQEFKPILFIDRNYMLCDCLYDSDNKMKYVVAWAYQEDIMPQKTGGVYDS